MFSPNNPGQIVVTVNERCFFQEQPCFGKVLIFGGCLSLQSHKEEQQSSYNFASICLRRRPVPYCAANSEQTIAATRLFGIWPPSLASVTLFPFTPRVAAMEKPLLQVSDVTKTFGTNTAVANLSLAVDAGEIHAVLGANGAGKTTLVRMPDRADRTGFGHHTVSCGQANAATDAPARPGLSTRGTRPLPRPNPARIPCLSSPFCAEPPAQRPGKCLSTGWNAWS